MAPEHTQVVGVLRETLDGERRVALAPDAVGRLRVLGLQVAVEAGAGAAALFPDADYLAAGAQVLDAAGVLAAAQVIVGVRPRELSGLRPGHVLIGLLEPISCPQRAVDLAARGVTAISLDLLPRTLSRAQSMDVLTSQANVAGYHAVLVAAHAFDGFFPLLMTAAGTTRPASVLVLGAGVAGLQALATARRLGAVVTGSDVRAAAEADVRSTGASFLRLGARVESSDGYARALSTAEQEAQQRELAAAVTGFDVVITTAQVPGGTPPLLLPAAARDAMRPGSVIVDLASGEHGGNVAGSVPGQTWVTPQGVIVIGAGNLPSQKPRAASTAYSRNVCSLLAALIRDGQATIDLADEVQSAIVITHEGRVVHPRVLTAIEGVA